MLSEDIPRHYFDKHTSLKVVRHYFSRAKNTIRIAVGFFTVRGYNLIRHSASGKKTSILVGIEEPGEKRLRKVLIQDILLDLRTGIDGDRRQAVRDLVEKMEGGNFRIIDARAMAHHAKLYIADETVALVASANVSGRGLVEAIEAGCVVEDLAAVAGYVRDYDSYFSSPDCLDITQDLLDALNSWLQLARPWDIYMKTLLALKFLEDTQLQQQRPTYQKPVSFQRDVVARSLRQIEELGGALVVASTGLGKTTIGTDIALRLHEAGVIRNVMIIGPKATEKSWQRYMRSAGLSYEYFVHQALDALDAKRNKDVDVLNEMLAGMDSGWLIVVDESHGMRNRHMDKTVGGKQRRIERLVFKRLVPAIKTSQAKVLLLTGTPFSTEIENVNNQLYLLPHTRPPDGDPKTLFPEMEEPVWWINELTDLKELRVASVITTPYVAKYYGTTNEVGVFITFDGEAHYIPRVRLFRTDFALMAEREMTHALESGCLKIKGSPMYRSNIETRAKVAWSSSPWALRDCLKKVIDTPSEHGYNVEFIRPVEDRRRVLEPVLTQLSKIGYVDDPKLLALCVLLDNHCGNNDKVIVFAEHLATIAYLEAGLKKLRTQLRVASTVALSKVGTPSMKSSAAVEDLLADFAPVANKNTRQGAKTYDVFLTTDAFGVGVNMQDACAVVNYDLAWTPIWPTQRAGRILRLWPTPRTVELHVFVPSLNRLDNDFARDVSNVLRRWDTLIRRDDQSKTILDLPILATQSEHSFDMRDHAPAQTMLLGELDLTNLEEQSSKLEVSSVFEHTAILERHRSYAQSLLDDILSVRTYDGKHPLVYVLIKCDGKHHWPVYNVQQSQLLPELTDTELLKLISCGENESTEWEDQDAVEKVADACINAWCQRHKVEQDQITRICALYLKPTGQRQQLEEWLSA